MGQGADDRLQCGDRFVAFGDHDRLPLLDQLDQPTELVFCGGDIGRFHVANLVMNRSLVNGWVRGMAGDGRRVSSRRKDRERRRGVGR